MSLFSPVITKCERERSAAQRIHYVSDYVPNCKPDGSYEEVQCSAASEDCWCVDRTGNEIPHSRTKAPLKCPRVGKSESRKCLRFYDKVGVIRTARLDTNRTCNVM